MSAPALKRAVLPDPVWTHLIATLKAPHPHHPSFDPDAIERAVSAAFQEDVPLSHSHRFEPQGFSLVRVAPDARLFLHTWPERGICTVDLHCTGERSAPELITTLSSQLGWECLSTQLWDREQ